LQRRRTIPYQSSDDNRINSEDIELADIQKNPKLLDKVIERVEDLVVETPLDKKLVLGLLVTNPVDVYEEMVGDPSLTSLAS